jgi:hypothetical protein
MMKSFIAAALATAVLMAAPAAVQAGGGGLDDASLARSEEILRAIDEFLAQRPILTESEVLHLNRVEGLARLGARVPTPDDAIIPPELEDFLHYLQHDPENGINL